MNKKTKIICTIGPASESEQTLKRLVKAGMNVARLNFSHGSHQEHLEKIERIKKVRKELNVPLAIMLDTKGPEYRIGTFKTKSVILKDGQDFFFTSDKIEGTEEGVSVSYKGVVDELEPGSIILVNDGLVKLKVVSKEGRRLNCKVLIGGKLSDRKSMSFPGKVFNHVYLSKQDKSDILFGIENDVDFVACSFVSCAQDIIDIRKFLDKNGGEKIQIIAKIENQSGIDNIDEILKHCEGLMVARGDLGVEIDYDKLPSVQKSLLKTCRLRGGISIVATEMLESMIENPRPTRAEISDVANAVYDGCSAIMLSGETASGKYPVEAVKAMAAIAEETEKNIHFDKRFDVEFFAFKNMTDAISHAACQLALDSGAKCIVAGTRSGQTARMVSRFRVSTPIVGMTADTKVYRQMALAWNVTPVLTPMGKNTDEMFKYAKEASKTGAKTKAGDVIVTTGGLSNMKNATSLIHVDRI